MLIDYNTIIHTSEQFDYISVRDCSKKFNFYLLYLTRPKNTNQTYNVRIDTYNKEKMEYYVSMIYPIRYSFLPVHRLSLQVDVPISKVTEKSKICPLKCGHGQCRYFSNSNKYFCQCSKGYSGMLCTIKNACDCSSDSICIEVVNNRSIYVCPLDKFGPRCYLKRTTCISNLCSNNSRCISRDEKNSEMKYFCLRSQSYMGSRCENLEIKIKFHFSKTIFIPQTIFIHFIYFPPKSNPLPKIPPDPIQIVEFHQQYYLALLQRYNYCENNGQCFQDNNTYPTSLACLCKECYYGSRCQFTTIGFGLSLDDILGYNIWPNIPFSRQSSVVKITTAFTILMFVIAMINGVLSMITFQTKRSLGIGSGVYLFVSSITSLLTMILFTLKFFLLVFSQMSIITNYSFLLSHCICTDILLKAFLAIGEWLNACVSIERILTIQLGIEFNKVRSKKAAKRVIFGLYLFILASFLHDPLNRHLLEDSEEQRTCRQKVPKGFLDMVLSDKTHL
ncbi:unnamed protein product [Rotaria sordida]|uniref:EGF-like domain-containing protein n=1 Tax=Rotaria sordida TaxID=392033 RepID=A0A813X9S6_9BILA|nr:unnamed protein product [Rotaria sordida]CAF0984269.1 unnamed protein product [Rotaria sordida]